MPVNKRGFYSPWGYIEENDYQSSENQFEVELNELFAKAEYDAESQKIKFYNNDGVELSGSSIDTSAFTSAVIESATYDSETKILTIKFSNGDTVEINLAELIDENEFGDGLQVVDGIVSLLKDPESEHYLTVSETGIKVSGIDAAIQAESDRATSAETDLQTAIDEERERAISAETALQEAIDSIESGSSEVVDALIEKLGYKDNDTLNTTNEHEVAFGEWNISNTSENPSGQTIFSIGNGTSDENRSNAIEVRKDGSVYLLIEGEIMNINDLLGQLAHEVYD